MNKRPFRDLTAQLEQELQRLHYTEGSIRYYRRMWAKIALFLESENAQCFTEELGMRFLETNYSYFTQEKAGSLTQSLVNVGRVVRMLGDFQQHRSILRRYYKHKRLLQTESFTDLLASFVADCQQRQYSRVTRDHYRKGAERFLGFLESLGLSECAQITSQHCSGYVRTWLGYQPKTMPILSWFPTNCLIGQRITPCSSG